MKMSKGVAPIIIVLLVAFGLVGGTATGYGLREQIKQAVSGMSTEEEIQNEVETELAKEKAEKSKFQLEGIATSVDADGNTLKVKIKSSTASIKEMRLAETPITIATTTSISNGSQKDLKITDIPINSQVHVGGTINNGILTAAKVIVQKEEGLENQGETFSIGGAVKEVGADNITITVKTANKKAKDKKTTDLTVKVLDSTIIEKGDTVIKLADIKVGDSVQATGMVSEETYTASKIEVKIQEQAGELEQEENANENLNTSAGNTTNNQNRETELETETNTNNSIKTNNGNSNSDRGNSSNRNKNQ